MSRRFSTILRFLCQSMLLCAILSGLVGCQSSTVNVQHRLAQPQPMLAHQLVGSAATSSPAKIALVLGSGGARGYAHIGVIEVLERYGIRPDFIVGVSAGSIVGALYASGKTPAELRQTALNLKPAQVREITFDLKGFFDGQKVQDYVNAQVGYRPLEQLNTPLYVVATELKHGQMTVFHSGNTGQAVRASSAIPSMFVPTEIEGKEYVDGGLVSPVPVELARQLGADIVIAVNILAQPQYTETSNVWGLFNQNINIMQNGLAARELIHADVVIQPDIREKGHIFSTKSREAAMLAGVQAAEQQMGAVLHVLAQYDRLPESSQNTMVQLQAP